LGPFSVKFSNLNEYKEILFTLNKMKEIIGTKNRKRKNLTKSVSVKNTNLLLDSHPVGQTNYTNKHIFFIELHPLDVAKQITLYQYDIFVTISPNQFNFKRWKDSEYPTPGIDNILQEMNRLSKIVCTEILTWPYHEGRVEILKKWIEVAHYLKKLGNFLGLMIVTIALEDHKVVKLKKIWKEVDQDIIALHKENRKLTNNDNNFDAYRDFLKKSTAPCLPFIGMVTQDIFFFRRRIPNNDRRRI